MATKKRFFVLTGPPGVGKTTVVKSVWGKLTDAKLPAKGFYTEEVRINGERIGFDAVSLHNETSKKPLARVKHSGLSSPKGPMIGKYVVDIDSFEKLALPLLEIEPKVLFIIDEIGKMELLSKQFEEAVKKIISNPEITILATVPVESKFSIPLLSVIRNHSSTQLFMRCCSEKDNSTNKCWQHHSSTDIANERERKVRDGQVLETYRREDASTLNDIIVNAIGDAYVSALWLTAVGGIQNLKK